MYIFAYGIISTASRSNQMYSRMMRLIADEAWVLEAALYANDMDIPVLTYGQDKVKGKLFYAEDSALKTLRELAKKFDRMNPPYIFHLNPIKVYTEKGAYDAHAFMYNSSEGLTKLDNERWKE